MTDNKPMEVLKKQLMNYLIERKCAKNNQDNYRYALNGMIDYCNRNNDGYYSDEAIAKYVAEKYDIHDYYSFHSCDNHYLSQICRICKILKDLNENRIPENRYLAKTECLSISEFANAIDDFHKYFPTNTLGKEMKYVPHIYSDEELKRFFYCTDHNCHFSPEVPYRQLVMPLIFRTIYCCGLRPGEATNLKAKDVDLEKGTLTILASKYDTDRIVPLSKSLLSMYLEYAPIVHVDFKSNAPFFPGYHGKPITNNNLNANFRKFLFQAGISYGGRGKGPRIYDFRHTFAVNCLKNLVQRGADMKTYYPILKTYMGHSFFKYTEYYLRLTKNMYPDIGEKLNATLGGVIPEVWGDECE